MSSDSRAHNSVQSPVAVAVPATIIGQCVLPHATRTDGLSEDLQMEEILTHLQEPRPLVTVHHLPDIALLEIFWFYSNNDSHIDDWHTLVHVCQRWRSLVFASPRRLDLQLLCDRDTPVRAMLDIWPALPIVIKDTYVDLWEECLDNIIAALEHPDRVCFIDLRFLSSSVWETFAEAMLVQFPELQRLVLIPLVEHGSTPVLLPLPDSFLGGSAPHLEEFELRNIPFPALPNLLLSASGLVQLSLVRLPDLEFISPESMVACLSSMNRLEFLRLIFQSPRSRPNQPNRPSPPPQTRVVLPALTDLTFGGMVDYSEDFLARIDTPILNKFSMTFFLDPSLNVLGGSLFEQFIDRANGLKPPKKATVCFDEWFTGLEISQGHGILETRCRRIDWQVDLIALVCGHSCSSIERLDLHAIQSPSKNDDDDDDDDDDDRVSTQLGELFRRFTAIRTLRVCRNFRPYVATALLDVTGESTVLLNLRDIFWKSKIPTGVRKIMWNFQEARQFYRQPRVAVHECPSMRFGRWLE
ncbi:hypothetical protein BC826DRAFT_508701 [Russula brevipes]|nr:hypothetical protein BC826DRAFT_508701 [Russula brevipes]